MNVNHDLGGRSQSVLKFYPGISLEGLRAMGKLPKQWW